MEPLLITNRFISSIEASKLFGYTPDYVARLCREGKIQSTRVGRAWLVDKESLAEYQKSEADRRLEIARELSEARAREYREMQSLPKKLERVLVPEKKALTLEGSKATPSPFVFKLQGMVVGLVALLIVGSVSAGYYRVATSLNVSGTHSSELTAAAVSQNAFDVAAIFTYETVQKLFDNTGSYFAALFSPTTIVFNYLNEIASTTPGTQVSTTTVVAYETKNVTNDNRTFITGVTKEYVDAEVDKHIDNLDDRIDERLDGIRNSGGGGSGSVTSVDASGGSTGLSFTGGPITSTGTLTLSGTLNATNGGTGFSSFTTGDILYADSATTFARLEAGSSGQVLKISGGIPSWAADLQGSGGAGAWATTSDSLAVYPSTPTNVVIIGASATTTTGNILEVAGSALIRNTLTAYGTVSAPNFTATTSAVNTFPNLLTTNATTTSLGLNSETFTDLTGTGLQNVGGALTINATGDWTGTFDGQEGSYYLNRANHTGTQLASTISDFSSTARGLFSSSATGLTYTSGTGVFSLTAGFTIPLSASTSEWAQAYASTTALSNSYIRGLFSNSATGLSYNSSTGVTSLASGYSIPLTASTTNWNTFYDTPSSRITAGNNIDWTGNTLDVTTTGDWTGTFDGQEGSYYLNRANHTGTQLASTISDFSSAVNSYINASTTIPKTYTANTFTAGNVFSGGLTIGTLNGPLQANNGVVSATSSVGVLYGGTGLTSAPAYGNILVGNSSGGYTLTATSSLGLAPSFTATYPIQYSSNILSLAFGTTTANTWGPQQTFTGLFATNASSTNATTTNLAITGLSSQLLRVDVNGRVSAATIGTGLTFDGTTLSSTGSGSGNVSTSSVETSSYIPYWTSTAGTPATLSGGSSLFTFDGTRLTATYASSTAFSSAYASSTNAFFGNLSLRTLNGPLQANNGVVSATTSIGALYGGTGQTSYAVGDILYADTTTSLARLPVSTNGLVLKLVGGVPSWQTDLTSGGGGGAGAWATTSDSLAIYPTDTSDVVIIGASATTTANSILEVFGTSYFSGNVGIGTTTPSQRLSVQGNALVSGNISGANITATGTLTAVNGLFTNATTTSLGLNSETFTDLTGTGLQNVGGALTINATGDWTGTFDGQEGSYYLNRANHTGTQLASTISDFSSTARGLFSATAPLAYNSSTGAFSYTGLATTSALSSSQLLVSNGTNGVYGISTSTASLGLGLTGSLTTLGTSQSLSIATSSLFTGTTGQVAYFSGTNQMVGTSTLFFAANRNIGIGTTTPQASLGIQATSVGFALLVTDGTSLNSAGIRINSSGDGAFYAFDADANPTALYSSGSATFATGGRIRWTNSATNADGGGTVDTNLSRLSAGKLSVDAATAGDSLGTLVAANIGVGTTSPSQRLSIQGNQYTSGSAFFGGALTATSTVTLSNYTNGALAVGSTGALYTFSTSTLTAASSTLLADTNTWSGANTFTTAPVLGSLTGLIYGNNGTLNQVATSTASLGLGLSGSLTTLGTSQSLSIATSSLFTGTAGQAAYFDGTNSMIGTSSLFIASNRNIGIGTTSPFAKLSIHANANDTYNSTLFAISSSTASGTTTLFSVSALGIVSTNNVISSGTVLGGDFMSSTNGSLSLPAFRFVNSTNTGIYLPATGQLGFVTGGTERLRINASGGLGAGTSTPYARITAWGTGTLFEAVTNASTTVFRIGQSGATTTALAISGITSSLLKTDSSGNVIPAIGGTDYANFAYPFPSNATSTSITFNGGLTASSLSIGSLSGVLYGNSGAVAAVATSTPTLGLGLSYSGTLGSFVGGSSGALTIATSSLFTGTTGQVAYFSGTNQPVGTSSLFIATSGSVGIGTSTPYGKLDIYNGTIYSSGANGGAFEAKNPSNQNASVALSWLSDIARIRVGGTGAGAAGGLEIQGPGDAVLFKIDGNGDAYVSGGDIALRGSNPALRFTDTAGTATYMNLNYVPADSTLYVRDNSAAINRFAFTQSGNLGIGTTSPAARLSVAGSSYFAGSVLATSTVTLSNYTNGALAVGATGDLYTFATSSLIAASSTLLADSNTWTGNNTFTGSNAFGTPTSINLSNATALPIVGGTTGTLTVARGGTGATSFTAGSIIFSNGTTFAQSNANLFYNSLTNNLALGTNTASNRLTVAGAVSIGENFITAAPTNGLIVEGLAGFGSTSPAEQLSVQGNALISGNLSIANINATGTASTTNLAITGITSSLLKTNALGQVVSAIAGTDYLAGGAGSATTTLSFSGPFTTSATPVVFGSSPITMTYTGLATTSALTSSGVLTSNGTNGVYSTATSSATLGLGLSGSLTGLGASNSLSIATSSLFTGTTGQVAYFSGTNQPVGTSSLFVATNGNIGIGTTSPAQQLSIYKGLGTNPISTFRVGNNDTTGSYFDVSALAGVAGNGVNVTLSRTGNDWGTPATISFNSGGSTAFSLGLISGNSGSFGGSFAIGSGNGDANPAVLITTGKNVGIATTSPAQRLSIQGNQYTSGSAFFGGALTATSTVTLSNYTNGALAVNGTGQLYSFSTSSWSFASSTLLADTNTWSGANTFTSAPRLGTLSGLIYGNNGTLNQVATSSATLGLGLTGSLTTLGTDSLSIATSSLFTGTTGQVAYFDGTNSMVGTSSIFITNESRVAIGTTTVSANTPRATIGSVGNAPALEIFAQDITTQGAFNVYAPLSTTINDGKAFSFVANGEGFARGMFYTDGSYGLGGGAGVRDVYLSRSSANNLLISSDRTTTGAANLLITGRIGIGSTSPFAKSSIHANNGETNTTLFAIGSSTASATTSLFTVDNRGLTSITSTVGGNTQTHFNLNASGADNPVLMNFNWGSSPGRIVGQTTGSIVQFESGGVTSFLGIGLTSLAGTSADTYITRTSRGVVRFGNGSINQNGTLLAETIGLGTSTPYAQLAIVATSTNGLGAPTTLFAIASTTGGTATSTLFSVSNRGNTTIGNSNGSAVSLNIVAASANTTTLNLTNGNTGGLSFNASSNNLQLFGPYGTILSATGNMGNVVLAGQTFSGSAGGSLTLNAGASSGGTDLAGANVSISAGAATGNAAGGSILFRTSIVGSTGSTVQTLSERLRISNTGNIGIASSSPFSKLSVHANNGDTNTTLFAVGSSTASATTTHFLINNIGNVGIGSTSPYAKLSVVGEVVASHFTGTSTTASSFGGNIDVGGTGQQYVGFSSGANALALNASTGTGLTSTASIFMNIDSNNDETTRFFAVGNNNNTLGSATELFRVQEDGNVGIGTTSPGYKLGVFGSASFGNSVSTTRRAEFDTSGRLTIHTSNNAVVDAITQTNFGITGANQGVRMPFYLASTTSTVQGIAASIDVRSESDFTTAANSDTALYFTTMGDGSATEKMRITGSGNVGIGTTSPSVKLETTGDISVTRGAGSYDGALLFGGGTGGTSPALIYGNRTTGGSLLAFYTNSLERVRIDNAGNMGIGTSTPNYNLNVYTNSVSNGNIATLVGLDTGTMNPTVSGSGAVIAFKGIGSNANFGAVGGYGNGTLAGMGLWAGTGSGAPQLYLTSAGNLGLGTTTPAAKLDVYSTSGTAFFVEGGVGGSNIAHFVRRNGATIDVKISGSNSDSSIIYGTSGTDRFAMGYDNSAANFAISAGSALGTTDRLVINSSGKVGIGSSTPRGTLTVSAAGTPNFLDIEMTGAGFGLKLERAASDRPNLQAYALSTGAAANFILNEDGGNVGIATSTPWGLLSINANALGAGVPQFVVGSSTATNFIVANNGRVGIATTTPANTLSVEGSGYITTSLGVGTNNMSTYVIRAAGSIGPSVDASYSLGGSSHTWSCVYYDGGSVGNGCVSDQRFKENIEDKDFGDALGTLSALKLRSFNYKDSTPETPTLGFIAQEVMEVAPEFVFEKNGYLGVKYSDVNWLTFEALQEMNLNLATIASTTTETTPASESFASAFFSAVFAKLVSWFENAENGIANVFVGSIKAKDTVCVGETCVTEDQLKALLEMAGNQDAPAEGGEEPPAEEPPAEDSPAEEPPADEPPVEESPAEEPPAEELPTDGEGETAGGEGAGEPGA